MNRLWLILPLLLLFAGNLSAQIPCPRLSESVGGFSVCIPDGWATTRDEGEKYRKLNAPSVDGFTANINFVEGSFNGSLADYVTAGIDYILSHQKEIGVTSAKMVSRMPFTTDSKLTGEMVTYDFEASGVAVRSIQYIFAGTASIKLIMTCTMPAKTQTTYIPIFQRAAASFRFDDLKS